MTLKPDDLTRLKMSLHAQELRVNFGRDCMVDESKEFWIAFIVPAAIRNLWNAYGTMLYCNPDYDVATETAGWVESQGLYAPGNNTKHEPRSGKLCPL